MEIIITSFYGTIIIPKNETVAIYTTEERYYDKDGNPVEKGSSDGMTCADLIFETSCQRFTFKKVYLGFDAFLELNNLLECFCISNKKRMHINLNKLLDFIQTDLLGSEKRIIIEDKD